MIFQRIKKLMNGVIGWVVIIGVAVPFALFGVSPYVGSPAVEDEVVVIGDRSIDRSELFKIFQAHKNALSESYGSQGLPEGLDDNRVLDLALNSLISKELIKQFGRSQGMTVGDQQLLDYIRTQPDLQGENGFDMERLQQLAIEKGMSQIEFEESYRDQIIQSQLEKTLTGSTLQVPWRAHLYNLANEYTRSVIALYLPENYYYDRAEIGEEQIDAYYQNNQRQFMAPEQLSLQYVLLERGRLIDDVIVSEEEIEQAYEQQQQFAGEDERRQASHILISLDEDANQEEIDSAFARMEEIRRRLADDANFGDLAVEYSQDPGSAANGGSLGEVQRGVMVKPFEDALFAMKPGEVSDIVTTQFGLHLIHLEEIISAQTQSLEEAREQLREQIAEEKSFQLFEEQVALFEEFLQQNPKDFTGLANAFSLSERETVLADRGQLAEPFYGLDDKLFVPELLEDHSRLSPVLTMDDSRAAVARVKEYRVQEPYPLSEVEDEIIDRLKREFATRQIQALKQRLSDELDSLDSHTRLDEIDYAPLERDDHSFLSRNESQTISYDDIETIFTIPFRKTDATPSERDGAEVDESASDPASITELATVVSPSPLEENGDGAEVDESVIDPASISELATVVSPSPSEENGDGADVAEQDNSVAAPRDFGYRAVDSIGLTFYIVYDVEGADSQSLNSRLRQVESRLSSMASSSNYRSLYRYLQDHIPVDTSGLQEN